MNDRYKLNSKLIRAYLDKEHRKNSWLKEKLGVSTDTVQRMLNHEHVPVQETLDRLVALLGIEESDLLIRREKAA